MIELNRIYNEDCLEGMKRIPDGSVDFIICDLPYGTTDCSWDSIIPLDKVWEQYNRVIKKSGAIILFAQQPFTAILVCSNLKLYRHSYVWIKDKCGNFIASRYQPGKYVEDIIVFSEGGFTHNARNKSTYNPIMVETDVYRDVTKAKKYRMADCFSSTKIRNRPCNEKMLIYGKYKDPYTKFPTNYLYFPVPHGKDRIHPTQKPVALIEYLIKTYTNEGETILDNCMGSGTTAVAAIRTKRNFIGFELQKEYFDIANKRIKDEQQQLKLF